MYRTIFPLCCLVALVLGVHRASVRAATLSVDTVLGSNHPYPNETIVVIDGDNPPTNLTIVETAIIGGIPGQSSQDVGIDAYGSSIVHMLGGFVLGVKPVLLHDQALLRMQGGEVGLVESTDNSRVVLYDGDWRVVRAYDSSRVRVNGGRDEGFFSVRTFGNAHAAINARLHLDFTAADSSTMVINAGRIETARVLGNSEVLLNGGGFTTGLRVSQNGVVRMRDFLTMNEENVEVSGNGVVHVYGTNLRFETDEENRKLVFGNWYDGDNFAFRYRLQQQGQIILHEVPEPGSWALLAVGAAGMLWMRRAAVVAAK